jgi:hypothetical protein
MSLHSEWLQSLLTLCYKTIPLIVKVMDQAEFRISTLPLQHEPYEAISAKAIANSNKGKIAVVTGAAGGMSLLALHTGLNCISFALCRNRRSNSPLSRASGATLALLDLSVEKQDVTKAACEKEGVKVKAYVCNVADLDNCRVVFEKIEKELGPIE